MKKLLLTTAMGAIVSTSVAVANEQDFSKNIYFKLEGGAAQFNNIKEKLVDKHSKFKIVPQVGLGVGSYIADRFRADITINHSFNPQAKSSNKFSFGQAVRTPLGNKYFKHVINTLRQAATKPVIADLGLEDTAREVINKFENSPSSFTSFRNETLENLRNEFIATGHTSDEVDALISDLTSDMDGLMELSEKKDKALYNLLTTDFSQAKIDLKINRKSKVENAMINGYFDIVDVANFKIFAGAGVGLAILHEKIAGSANLVVGNKVVATIDKTQNKQKVAKNFAYALKLGASTKITDNIDLDLTGEYKDFGKTKSVKLAGIEIGKVRYRSYGATAGIRFSF